jgi:hypothetical protein
VELLAAPASAFDFAEALDDGGSLPIRLTRWSFGLFARQVDAGGAVTLRAGGQLVMIAGLYHAGTFAEAWWAVGPALRAHLRPALRLWRDLFEKVGLEAAPLEVRAHVPAASVAGHRLAPLFGLTKAGETEIPPFGRLTVWRRDFTCPWSPSPSS